MEYFNHSMIHGVYVSMVRVIQGSHKQVCHLELSDTTQF